MALIVLRYLSYLSAAALLLSSLSTVSSGEVTVTKCATIDKLTFTLVTDCRRNGRFYSLRGPNDFTISTLSDFHEH